MLYPILPGALHQEHEARVGGSNSHRKFIIEDQYYGPQKQERAPLSTRRSQLSAWWARRAFVLRRFQPTEEL